jgi:hypothetical protein
LTLGEALTQRETELGVSANRGALLCDVSRKTYDDWKFGRRSPKARHWRTIAEFLDCSVGRVAIYVGVLTEDDLVDFAGKGYYPRSDSDQRGRGQTEPKKRSNRAA